LVFSHPNEQYKNNIHILNYNQLQRVLLEVRKKGCKVRLANDGAYWDATVGEKLFSKHADIVARIESICGIEDLKTQIIGTPDNFGDAIKDITDAWAFDMIEGFTPQEGINVTSLLEFRTVAVKQLFGRIIGTEEQITYMNGELPERLVENFNRVISHQGPAGLKSLKLYAYHGHREMMYALAAFLGIHYNIEYPSLPKGGIPPGTTLFFELHYIGKRDAPAAWNSFGVFDPKGPVAAAEL